MDVNVHDIRNLRAERDRFRLTPVTFGVRPVTAISTVILKIYREVKSSVCCARSSRGHKMRKFIRCTSLAFLCALVGADLSPMVVAQSLGSAKKNLKYDSKATKALVPLASDSIATEPDLKIAFIGDVGRGPNQQAVLQLIKSEGAQAVLHQGDFDYANNPSQFWGSVDAVLGPNFPYFVSIGNHDVGNWPATANPSYSKIQKDRMARIGITPDEPDLNDGMYSIVFKGLKVVFVGERRGAGDAVYTPYIEKQLSHDNHIWVVCSWHRNMQEMQVGGKVDDMGWGVYEACKNHGAIIATGHEHSYERTKTLTSMQNQTVDPKSPDPNHIDIGPGRSFAFVSGLGGESIREQIRCLPISPPYGCKGEWAKIYTSNQSAQYGVLFITFNVDHNSNKAHGYFKNINGQIVDDFDITKDSYLTQPGATAPPVQGAGSRAR